MAINGWLVKSGGIEYVSSFPNSGRWEQPRVQVDIPELGFVILERKFSEIYPRHLDETSGELVSSGIKNSPVREFQPAMICPLEFTKDQLSLESSGIQFLLEGSTDPLTHHVRLSVRNNPASSTPSNGEYFLIIHSRKPYGKAYRIGRLISKRRSPNTPITLVLPIKVSRLTC
jgi:hypothetical protein